MPVALQLLRATQLVWKCHSPQKVMLLTTVDLNPGRSPHLIYHAVQYNKTVQYLVPLSAALCREFASEIPFSLDS